MDERRGEKIVLFTTDLSLDREAFSRYLVDSQISPLCCPRQILVIEDIPLLATGKTDYVTLAQYLSSL